MILTITKFDFNDYVKSATELIVGDMMMTRFKHIHDRAGLDSSPYQERIYNTVFMIAGILEKDRTDELKDMYFKKLEMVLEVDIHDEKKLFEIAEEILLFLNSWKHPDTIYGLNFNKQ